MVRGAARPSSIIHGEVLEKQIIDQLSTTHLLPVLKPIIILYMASELEEKLYKLSLNFCLPGSDGQHAPHLI